MRWIVNDMYFYIKIPIIWVPGVDCSNPLNESRNHKSRSLQWTHLLSQKANRLSWMYWIMNSASLFTNPDLHSTICSFQSYLSYLGRHKVQNATLQSLFKRKNVTLYTKPKECHKNIKHTSSILSDRSE